MDESVTRLKKNLQSGSSGRRSLRLLLALFMCVLALAACREAGGEEEMLQLPPEPEDGVLVYAALNPVTESLQRSVDRFNKRHEDVQMEIRDYSDEGGPQRLLVELVAGRVPDLMELRQVGASGETDGVPMTVRAVEDDCYWMPYRQMAQRGYLEDLWPYIENDPELGREGVVEAPLKAAEVNGGLYMLFKDVRTMTLMGSEQAVGDRYGWTFGELMEAFSAMPEGSTILRYNATRWDVYSQLISHTLDQYVNWETGECFFDSREFRDVLEFLKAFPAEFETLLTPEQVEEEIIDRIRNGKQMLECTVIYDLSSFCYKDIFWNGRAAFPGYPTADGSAGGFFYLRGTVLTMSSACRHKEAAWDYMRELITRRYNVVSYEKARNDLKVDTSINRADYDTGNQAEIMEGKKINLEKDPQSWPPWRPFSNPRIEVFVKRVPDEEDIARSDALINSITQIYWPDDALVDIVWEAIGPYFAGDKTQDETVDLVQRRVALYVNESR